MTIWSIDYKESSFVPRKIRGVSRKQTDKQKNKITI